MKLIVPSLMVLPLLWNISHASNAESSTDRPTRAASPLTLEPGAMLVEAGLVTYSNESRSMRYGDVNLRIGIMKNLEAQLAGPAYGRKSGFGNSMGRLKINLRGNDGAPLAIAVMPYLSSDLAAGLAFPVSFTFSGSWSIGATVEWATSSQFASSIVLAGPMATDLSGYLEVSESTLGTGLLYWASKRVQLDLSIGLEISKAADVLVLSSGISFRI